MKILIIDTCLGYLSIALASTHIIKEVRVTDLNQQSKLLAPLVSDLLKSTDNNINELDTILITRGPGSFTGTRIGLAFALGIHQITQCKIYTCSTLATLEESYNGEVLATITAGAAGYFTQRFVNHVATSDITIMQKDDINKLSHTKIIGHYREATLKPDPQVILKLFHNKTLGIFSEDLSPLYIKAAYF